MDVRVLPKGRIIDIFAVKLPGTKSERDPRLLTVQMAHYGAAAKRLPDWAYVSVPVSHQRLQINAAYREDFKKTNGRECPHDLWLNFGRISEVFPDL
jgi:hypothetical protein